MNSRHLKITYRALLSGMLLCIPVVLGSSNVLAEDAQSSPSQITMSPGSQRIFVKPGDTYEGSFKIYNFGEGPFEFNVYGRPYSIGQSEDYTSASFEEGSERSNVYRWLQFDQTKWTLTPGNEATVSYKLRAPEDAAPGGNYGVIFAETAPTQLSGQTAIAANSRLGHILQVEVEGQIDRSGNYLDTVINFFQFAPPLNLTSRVQNDGNVHDEATLSVSIKDIFGREKFSEQREYIIYPGTTRAMNIEWQNARWVGLYKVETRTSFLDSSGQTDKWVLVAPLWLYIVVISSIAGGIYATFRRSK